MIVAWATLAAAQQVSLGADRIAVLDPGFAPSAVRTSRGSVLDVVVSPPVLLLLGLAPGQSELVIEREDGPPSSLSVTVEAADRAPVGGPGLVGRREILSLPVGGAALCSVPGRGQTRIESRAIGVYPFDGRWLVHAAEQGRSDIVAEDGSKNPLVIAVSTGAASSGPSCVLPSETVKLLVGEEITLGSKVAEHWLSDPGVAHATLLPTGQIRVAALGPGTAVIASRSSDKSPPQLRTIVVAPAL